MNELDGGPRHPGKEKSQERLKESRSLGGGKVIGGEEVNADQPHQQGNPVLQRLLIHGPMLTRMRFARHKWWLKRVSTPPHQRGTSVQNRNHGLATIQSWLGF